VGSLIVRIVPLWAPGEEGEEERLVGFRVSVAGETFEVRDVFINDEREKNPCYTVRFVLAVDVHINGEDEVLIYT
jgi:hypothetical protein